MNSRSEGIVQDIVRAIGEKRRFLVTSHIKPDGDAVGSLLAMTYMLRRMGKSAIPHLEDAVPDNCRFLPGAQEIVHQPRPAAEYDVAVILDCGDFSRVGEQLHGVASQIPLIVNIDHHLGTAPYGHLNWVETSASSTCELLYRLCDALDIRLDPHIATQLYTGLMTDTGSFRFTNTTQQALEMAAKLVSAGAEPAVIAGNIYDSAPAQRLHLLAQVLATVRFFHDNRLATAEVTQQMFISSQTTPMDSEGFINELRSVKTVELALLFREGQNSMVHVSMRSKGNVDVAALARIHGGGGHRQAAAFRVKGSLPEIRRHITQQALDHLLQHEVRA